MNYFSTRNTGEKVSSAEAIVKGLAADGGLFIPEEIPQVKMEGLEKLSYPQLAAELLPYLLPDYDREFLKQATEAAYGPAFHGKAGHTEKEGRNVCAGAVAWPDLCLQRLCVTADAASVGGGKENAGQNRKDPHSGCDLR